ncbi:hypothetical protein A4S06_08280 [Erysipelotrichaceae bacterium MTC7]|nr:hypothetical protein A4S06_08280 [Erysipelotrichaceae bacterium MTC7]
MNRIFLKVIPIAFAISSFFGKPPIANFQWLNISASTGQVYVGESFTVTISTDTAATFSVSATNATVGGYEPWADASSSKSVTITPINVGPVTVTASGPVSNEDGSGDTNLSKSVTVNAVNRPTSNPGTNTGGSSNNQTNNNQTTEEPKDEKKDVTLKSLSVSEGTMEPGFDPSVDTYIVKLTSDKTSVEVKAEATDATVTVEGTGKHTLKEGENNITVTTKADDGGSKAYTIRFQVEKKPSVYLPLGDSKDKYGILTLDNAKKLDGFEEIKIKVNNQEVQAIRNNKLKVTLLYMTNSKNERGYYIYDEKSGKLTSVYIPIAVAGKNLAIVTIPEDMKEMEGFTFTKVKVEDTEVEGWTFKDSKFKNYVLVYLMDENGEMKLFQYEKSSNTIQPYSNAAPITMSEYEKLAKSDALKPVLMGVSGVLSIAVIGSIVALFAMKKKLKK